MSQEPNDDQNAESPFFPLNTRPIPKKVIQVTRPFSRVILGDSILNKDTQVGGEARTPTHPLPPQCKKTSGAQRSITCDPERTCT